MNEPTVEPQDVKRDRVVCVMGGVIVTMHNDVLERFSDPGSIWINMIPCEESQREKDNPDKIWPHERQFRILHEFYYGTADEIIDDLKTKLVAACNATTLTSPEIVRKQNELMERYGLQRFVCGNELKADKKDLDEREAQRAEMSGHTNRQDGWTRWELMRLVAQWHSRRFTNAKSAEISQHGLLPSNDSPEAVQDLIDALTVLKQDREALETTRA